MLTINFESTQRIGKDMKQQIEFDFELVKFSPQP
jgi:hypothetical protein